MAESKQKLRRDPLTAFCFSLEIESLGIKGAEVFFKSVSGLRSESEVVAFREGGLNISTHQLVGPTKWPNLVLKMGFTGESTHTRTLAVWRQKYTFDHGDGPKVELKRVNGKLIQYANDMNTPVCYWHFLRGWPCKWEGPDYDASKSDLAIETLEIAHEGLVYESA